MYIKIRVQWTYNDIHINHGRNKNIMWFRRGMHFNIRAAWFCISCNLSIWLVIKNTVTKI